jgi:bifunctional non-homologous end joining protein LigD
VSRNARDWTDAFPTVRDAVRELPGDCVIDGEVCALDARGVPSFALLQQRGEGNARIVYCVFDALYRDGEDLRGLPLDARRERLAAMVAPALSHGLISVSTAVTDHDEASILEVARATGLEGVVAKQVGSTYTPGRSKTWLKIKCLREQEFAVIGWVPIRGVGAATSTMMGALLLALVHEDGEFHYAGRVGTGFSNAVRDAVAAELAADAVHEPMAKGVPRSKDPIRYVRPRLVAQVSFAEWTPAGHVRHPTFRGLRADKSPRDCKRETPA